MHIYVDYDVLFGNKLPDKFNLSEVGFHDEGNGLLTIDYYDIKKIKILNNSARVKEIDKQKLFNHLLANLKLAYGDVLYKGFIENKLDIDEITDTYILFDIGNVKIVGQTYGEKFKKAFDDTIEYLLN